MTTRSLPQTVSCLERLSGIFITSAPVCLPMRCTQTGENFIKEGVYGFGLDKSICRSWAGAKLYFELIMLAYNLMNWFKETALGNQKEMAGTIRWKVICIPAKLVKRGHSFKLKLADWWTYQRQFQRAQKALI